MKGTVIRSTGSWYEVVDEQGNYFRARLRGKFKLQELKVTNPIAVGDMVHFEHENENESTVAITAIDPRKNYIIRQSVHKAAHGHLIASNLDQSILVVTLAMPRTSTGFIDRFLVTSEAFRIPAVLVFNKIDLYDEESMRYLEAFSSIYSKLGYTCINTSTVIQTGIDALKSVLENKTSLFSGHSGVGKSSLINVLVPELNLPTNEISNFAEKGVHTTTFAERFSINAQTHIIDTPGIKELGIFEVENEILSHFFPEMRMLLNQCKFHNCQHQNEPKCMVIEKVKSGEIALSRYESYLSMLLGTDNRK